jgi:hypothetical protein
MEVVYLIMRVVVLAGVFVGFLVGATPNDAERRAYTLARWAGMDRTVEFQYLVPPDPVGIGGGFAPPGTYCSMFGCIELDRAIIMIAAGERVPRDMIDFVVLHEVGHYLQWKEIGALMFTSHQVALEWDADIRAMNMLCHRGRDGRQIMRDFFDWARVHHNYHGDPDHGSARDRIAHALAASTHCRVRHEAP